MVSPLEERTEEKRKEGVWCSGVKSEGRGGKDPKEGMDWWRSSEVKSSARREMGD